MCQWTMEGRTYTHLHAMHAPGILVAIAVERGAITGMGQRCEGSKFRFLMPGTSDRAEKVGRTPRFVTTSRLLPTCSRVHSIRG